MNGLHTAATRPLHSFSTAWKFLTIFPGLPGSQEDHHDFTGASYYFTVVGMVTGGLIGGGALLLTHIAPPLIIGAVVAVALSLISGFLHLDGLADTTDGFMSCRDRERSLVIMKDSRIGVMGAVSIMSLMLIKTAALVSLPTAEFVPVLIIASGAGRTATILMMSHLPYARAEGGLGNLFFEDDSVITVSIISIILLLIAMVVLMPQKMLVLLIMFVLTMVLFCMWCIKKIGGYTGDTLGAVCELMETAILTGAVLSF